tara:strand:- start:26443 stop:28152 length:1710 start_codon:yes stop_codon:yes gene_type:complete
MLKIFKKIIALLTRSEKKQFKIIVSLMFLAMIFETLGIAAIIPFIGFTTESSDNYLNSYFQNYDDKEILIIITFIVISIYLIKNIFLAYYYFLETRFSYKTRFNLGVRLYNHYLNNSYNFHILNNSSTLITKIVQETTLFGAALVALSVLITEFLIVLGITTLLLVIKPSETLFIILIFFILGIIYFFFTRKIVFNLGKNLVSAQKDSMKVLSESLKSVQEIIIFKVKSYFSKIFEGRNMKVAHFASRINFINRLPKVWFETIAILIVALIIIVSSFQNRTNLEIIETLAIFLLSALKIIPSMNKILSSSQQIKSCQAAVDSLSKDLNDQSFIQKQFADETSKITNFQGNVIFKNVGFKFSNNDYETLKNLNLNIYPKDFVAIIGKTGSGKTTFLNLLMGLLDATSGEIIVDGKDVKKNIIQWRSKIGFVPQKINLLDDTLKQNIAYGVEHKNISSSNIEKSLSLSQLTEYTNNNYKKIDSNIGEGGIKISGGQKQRLAIARALYRNPEILVLDEPTSSLDQKTTADLLQTLKLLNREKTIIIVSHDIDDFEIFNKVYEIKNQTLNKIK